MTFMTRTMALVGGALLILGTATDAGAQPPRTGFPGRPGPPPDDQPRQADQGPRPREPRVLLSVHGGAHWLDAESSLWSDNALDFGLADSDFTAGRVGAELFYRVAPGVDIVAGIEGSQRVRDSSYLDFTFDDGGEIIHSTRLSFLDLTVGARLQVPGSRARFRPYVSGGFLATFKEYSEIGDFTDFNSGDVFFDEFFEETFLPGFWVAAGADATIAHRGRRRVDLFAEYRFQRSTGEHGDDYDTYGDITYQRSGFLAGVRFGF